MAILAQTITNNKNYSFTIRAPGVNNDPSAQIVIPASAVNLNLLTLCTEDTLWALQAELTRLVGTGAITVTQTIDTATFAGGYEGGGGGGSAAGPIGSVQLSDGSGGFVFDNNLNYTGTTLSLLSNNYNFTLNPGNGTIAGVGALTGPADDDLIVNSVAGFDLNLSCDAATDFINFKFNGHADFKMGESGVFAIDVPASGGIVAFRDNGTEIGYIQSDPANMEIKTRVGNLSLVSQFGDVILQPTVGNVQITSDVSIPSEKKYMFGNGNDAWLKFSVAHDTAVIKTNVDGRAQLSAEAGFEIYANTAANGSGPFDPVISLTSTGQVQISSDTGASDAVLNISSASKGMVIPRLTTAARTAIGSPGMIVYDTDIAKLFVFTTAWEQITSV